MRTKNDHNDPHSSLMALEQYLCAMKWIPPLTSEEQAQLLDSVAQGKHERMKACPDAHVLAEAQQARNRLVEGFQRLVVYLAKRYLRYTWRLELLDLIQEGNLGLMEAIERHEVSTGHPLSALAGRCISSALFRAIWERDGLMRLKGAAPKEVGRLEKAERRLMLQLGRQPSRAEIAREMQLDEQRVDKLRQWQRQFRGESLEGLLSQEAEERLGSVNLFGGQDIEDAEGWIGLQEVVSHVMQVALTPGQRRVLWLRLGLDQQGESRQPGEVAQLLNKPLPSVHSVETQAKKRLREALALRGVGPHGEEVA